MNKVFFLLRDNNQLGPFTIDELLQHKLSANDLIWVDGYSHAWLNPSELDLLKLSIVQATTNAADETATPTANSNGLTSKDNSVVDNSNKIRRKRKC